MILSRRKFVLTGLVAAPAVVAINRLMPVRVWNSPDVHVPNDHFFRDYRSEALWKRKNGVLYLVDDGSRWHGFSSHDPNGFPLVKNHRGNVIGHLPSFSEVREFMAAVDEYKATYNRSPDHLFSRRMSQHASLT
jgi:hypothetical protein